MMYAFKFLIRKQRNSNHFQISTTNKPSDLAEFR